MAVAQPGKGPGSAMDIFSSRDSVTQRFPGLDGLELVEAIFDLYSINKSAHLDFYDSKGMKMIVPHEINIRHQSQVFRKYVTWPI